MKTTIDISDKLFHQARKTAQRNHVTLKELTEEGLELAIEKRRQKNKKGIRLVVYGDPGKPANTNLDWEHLRPLIYPS